MSIAGCSAHDGGFGGAGDGAWPRDLAAAARLAGRARPGGKMWIILRRIQRAHFRRNRRAGSRATSVAVRHRRRVHAHMRFSAVFHTKTLTGPIARLRVVWLQNPCGGTRRECFGECARVFRGGSLGDFSANAILGGFCHNFFGTRGGNLSPHCRAANVDLGTKRAQKIRAPRFARRGFFSEFFFKKILFVGQSYFFLEKNRWGGFF